MNTAEVSGETEPKKIPLLEVSKLNVEFSKQKGFLNRGRNVIRAVRNVSFEIFESEILSLVGESGSGKTTVARCIMALKAPTSGSIKYKGVDLNSIGGKKLLDYRRDVQMIFQDPFESFSPRLTVLETISYPIRRLAGETNRTKIRDIAAKLLSEVGLVPEDVLHKFPHQLSGGERQRVNIAKALASNPKLLVADEPVTMLDASQRLNVLALLMRLKQSRNLTIILITHDLASAQIMSSRIAVMYLGRIVELGPTDVILSEPCHPYTQMILQSTPRLIPGHRRVLRSTIAGEERPDYDDRGCSFRPRCKYATSICSSNDPILELKRNQQQHFAACHNPLH